MRKKLWLISMAVLIVAAGVWLFNTFPDGNKQLVEYGNLNEMVEASQDRVAKVENFKYKSSIEAGNQIKVSLTNKVDRQNTRRQMIDFSWIAPNMSGMAAMYAKGDSVYLYNPLKDKWELPSEEPAVKPFLDFFWRQIGLADPVENWLSIDTKSQKISRVENSAEKIPDTVVVQVIPNAAAMSELTKALPPQFAGAELKDIRQFFWISNKDLLISRYEVTAKVAFFGLKTMDFKTISTPSDYDKTEIKLPERLNDKIKLQESAP